MSSIFTSPKYAENRMATNSPISGFGPFPDFFTRYDTPLGNVTLSAANAGRTDRDAEVVAVNNETADVESTVCSTDRRVANNAVERRDEGTWLLVHASHEARKARSNGRFERRIVGLKQINNYGCRSRQEGSNLYTLSESENLARKKEGGLSPDYFEAS